MKLKTKKHFKVKQQEDLAKVKQPKKPEINKYTSA